MSDVKESWLEAAREAAKVAGGTLRAGIEDPQQVNFEDKSDVKLQADEDSEQQIRDILKETELPVIGEEQGGEVDLVDGDQYYWVVDPLDGTYNYLRGQPMVCVSIGLMRGSGFVYGCIYDFMGDQMLSGGKGMGLFINGKVMKPKWVSEKGKGCIVTGFPAGSRYTEATLLEFMERVRQFKKIRMIGSAAMALAFVAQGKADAYYEESTRLWDIAAGAALVEGAGGFVKKEVVGEPNELKFNVWGVAKQEWIS